MAQWGFAAFWSEMGKLAELDKVFGSVRRWLIAFFLAWACIVAGEALIYDQSFSLALVWDALKRTVGIVSLLMVYFSIQRLMSGRYSVQ